MLDMDNNHGNLWACTHGPQYSGRPFVSTFLKGTIQSLVAEILMRNPCVVVWSGGRVELGFAVPVRLHGRDPKTTE